MRRVQTRSHRVARGTLAVAVGTALVVGLAPTSRAADRVVPVPTVEVVPNDVGIRGRAQTIHFENPANFGYLEQELFFSGTALSYGTSTAGSTAPYKSRMLVMRPADPSRFNGTVLVEWLNVTGQTDAAAGWFNTFEYLVREGYAFVGVSAQSASQGPSPTGLKGYDPVRYGSLSHPGDDYSRDIFSQAGQAIRFATHAPLGELEPQRLIAAGQSQSGGRLASYLRNVHRQALRDERSGLRVFDGFNPMTAGTGDWQTNPIPTDLEPILWVNSQSESTGADQQPDGGNFRLIEIAGAPHFGGFGLTASTAGAVRYETGTSLAWDREIAGQYGERGGGPCPRGMLPTHFAYAALLDHLDRWLRDPANSTPPPDKWPRIERGSGNTDKYGNVKGGFRLPPIDVPLATYTASCVFFGSTDTLPPTVLAKLYPDHETYVAAMRVAIEEAVTDGRLLPPDAAELIARAENSDVGRRPLLLAVP